MNQEEKLDYLIDYLQKENLHQQAISTERTETIDEKIALFRGLCNIRPPRQVSEAFLNIQDAFLTEWNHSRPSVSLEDLTPVHPQLYLWQGDITRLAVDGIVNAANSNFLGCTQANHNCIDNIIHTRAGVQLRLDCHDIIESQGRKEPIGKAKITKAYNLPSRYVIHTVGPFIDERGPSAFKEHLLASSYESCLQLADEHALRSIAFCSISTGEFNFPNEQAAEIAINTVTRYLNKTGSKLQVIFDVFKDKDLHIYERLLRKE